MEVLSAPPLSALLNELWMAKELPVRERRWLANATVGRCQSAGKPAATSEVMDQLALVLGAMSRMLGRPGLRVADAKRALRDKGPAGVALASRLGRLSKGRNVLAHLDVDLTEQIRDLLVDLPEGDMPCADGAHDRDEGRAHDGDGDCERLHCLGCDLPPGHAQDEDDHAGDLPWHDRAYD